MHIINEYYDNSLEVSPEIQSLAVIGTPLLNMCVA